MSISDNTTVSIGIAGLGTVGVGIIKILAQEAERLEKRCGKRIEVTAVSARQESKDRGIPLDHLSWYHKPVELAMDADIDIVVEVMGGEGEPALELCERALKDGKHVVTANKALIARHGMRLATLAEQNDCLLAFEAAVAGGIPVVKALREGLAANEITQVMGIMNGTCNYILTRMGDEKLDFDECLEEAQRLGYAEADPTFDVDGIDTAHKLAILTAIAYGAPLDFNAIAIEGIREVSVVDIEYARELGYVVKLLGISEAMLAGVSQHVQTVMVPNDHALAHVSGVDNAVFLRGNHVQDIMLQGPGAGEGPTASAVVADIVDIVRGCCPYPFGVPVDKLEEKHPVSAMHMRKAYYLRIDVEDRQGILADVTAALKEVGISMDSILQKMPKKGSKVHIVGVTKEIDFLPIQQALELICGLDGVLSPPQVMQVMG